MFRKTVCAIISISVLCGLTGCGTIMFNADKDIDPVYSPGSYSRQILNNIQEFLKDEDAEAISALFAEYLNITSDDVNLLLDYADGKIVSIDKSKVDSGGGEQRDGKYTEYSYGGHFTVSTDTGKEYEYHFAGYAVYDEKPEKVGLEYLYLFTPDNSSDVCGVGLDFNEEGQKTDRNGNVVIGW